jgi:ADP-L-glycero-D-manno-heptose 6-epimerase
MILVTGGAGFIGSNLIRGLNEKGLHNIIVVDNLTRSEKHLNLNSLKIIDYVDKEDFLLKLNSFKHVKTIFHQGACSSTTETDGRYMMKNNFEYSKILLNFSLETGADFLYASSASVYGNGDKGFQEDPECEYPLNIYAFSKFMFDNYVRRIFKNHKPKSQILGLRYFNVYGFQENHKGPMASVAFHFYKQMQAGSSIKLFKGSENFVRDFVFVKDAVDVNLYCYEKKVSGILNCGTGNERSFYDVGTIFKKLEPSVEIEFIPFPDHLKGKYQAYTKADLTNLRKAGYTKDFHTLEDGISLYYNCLKETGGFIVD